jgi:hypothetical protein
VVGGADALVFTGFMLAGMVGAKIVARKTK